jgi:hypothetical protein
MKILGNQQVELTISEEEVIRITRDKICRTFGWNSRYRIEDGKVYLTGRWLTANLWEDEIFERIATEDDLAVERVLSGIKMGL